MKTCKTTLLIVTYILLLSPILALADKAVVWVADASAISSYQASVRDSYEAEEVLASSTNDVADILTQMQEAENESDYIGLALNLAEGYEATLGKIDITIDSLKDTKSKATSALSSGSYKESAVMNYEDVMQLDASISDINNHWGSFETENKVFITAMADLDKGFKALNAAGISGNNNNSEESLMRSIEVADFKLAFLSKLKKLYLAQGKHLAQRIEGGEQIHLSSSSILGVANSASSVARKFSKVDKMYRNNSAENLDQKSIEQQTSRSPYQR